MSVLKCFFEVGSAFEFPSAGLVIYDHLQSYSKTTNSLILDNRNTGKILAKSKRFHKFLQSRFFYFYFFEIPGIDAGRHLSTGWA